MAHDASTESLVQDMIFPSCLPNGAATKLVLWNERYILMVLRLGKPMEYTTHSTRSALACFYSTSSKFLGYITRLGKARPI